MSSKDTPLDTVIGQLTHAWPESEAKSMVADAIDHLAGRMENSEELRDLTDDHMSDIQAGAEWLRGVAEGLRP